MSKVFGITLAVLAVAGCSDAEPGASPEADVGIDAAAAETSGSDTATTPPDSSAGDVAPDKANPSADVVVQVCPPGLTGCMGGDLLVCNEDGTAVTQQPCPDELVCNEGSCVECATDTDCAEHEGCVDQQCVTPAVQIVTEEIPPALQANIYWAELHAVGGAPPYAWEIIQGGLPEGVYMGPDGVIAGLTSKSGTFPFKVRVEDTQGGFDAAGLSLRVLDHGLHITSASPLPLANDGDAYQFQFEAIGGASPYFWGIADGELPPGLILGSNGLLSGTVIGDGNFEFDLKVFDNGIPTLTSVKSFELPITIAPLEIVGDQEVDLFITKLIVLPLIIVAEGFPVPYLPGAQLQAKGGRKPYHWSEEKLPDLVSGFIPNAGLPQGLTLSEDGRITGSVTDTSLVIEVTIPLTNIKLSGFFFAARCRDDQPVPDEETATYIIPTAPIGGN